MLIAFAVTATVFAGIGIFIWGRMYRNYGKPEKKDDLRYFKQFGPKLEQMACI